MSQNLGTTTQVVWTDSTTDVGNDFNLTCASCCRGSGDFECDYPTAATGGTAGVAVCADSTLACSHLRTALHGRWMWPYLAHPAPDLSTDEPSILFTGDPDATCTTGAGSTSLPDIYRADWDTTSAAWVVEMSGSCPVIQIVDAHDPGITPIGSGAYKVYVVDSSHNVTAHYYDGSSWEATTSTPYIEFDDGPPHTVVAHTCIANIDSFVATGPHEGMFFYIATSPSTFETFSCTSGDTLSGTKSHIYFAELQN